MLFAALLKYWRGRRGLSQLDLALGAGVSAKHVSFLETGRARPGEEMVLTLAAALDVPLREQNDMLRAAGFAPIFAEPPLDAMDDPVIQRVLDRMMCQHEPFPMIAMNRCYDVLRMNDSATRLFSLVGGVEDGVEGGAGGAANARRPLNAMRLLFAPETRPLVVGWADVAREMVARVHREVLHRPQDAALATLLDDLLASPGVPQDWRRPDFTRGADATFAFRFQLAGLELSFLTTVMTFSAPQNITLDELQIESYFPLDDATEQACAMLRA